MANPRFFISLTLSVNLMMISFIIPAQVFEPAGISFAGAGRGDVSWCDYDNDHDLDVLVTGLGDGDQRVSILYRNDEGVFTDSGVPFTPVDESVAAWGDYDHDGDQDLLLAGNSADEGDITRIYVNDNGDFIPIDPGIGNIQQGVVKWIDFDGDDDLDIFISGSWITQLCRNEDGIFIDDGQDFGFFSNSAASFGDYDNDGDFDLLINGDSGAGAVSKIVKNESGVYVDSGTSLTGLMAGTADWVDYDNDGDLDAAISGNNDALEARFYLYKNQDKQFEMVFTGIDGFALGSADWGDYDNDGDPDLLMSGKATGCGAVVSGIYRNDGNDVFYKISQDITTAIRCSLGWADYDNDGDLDFLISGLNYSDVPFTKLYQNLAGSNTFDYNTPPGAPGIATAETDGDEVEFSWSGAWDAQTPSIGLTYNFRLGTSPGANDVVPPMSDLDGGYRLVPGKGNAGQNSIIKINDMMPGTYYWSVQSIDQAMEGSVFSEEQSFTITTTGIDKNSNSPGYFIVYPNPARDQLLIQLREDLTQNRIMINDLSGKTVISVFSNESLVKIDTRNLKPGAYLIIIESDNLIFSQQFLKF